MGLGDGRFACRGGQRSRVTKVVEEQCAHWGGRLGKKRVEAVTRNLENSMFSPLDCRLSKRKYEVLFFQFARGLTLPMEEAKDKKVGMGIGRSHVSLLLM